MHHKQAIEHQPDRQKRCKFRKALNFRLFPHRLPPSMRLCVPITLGCTRAVRAEPAKPSRLSDTEQIIGLLVLAVVVVPLPLPLCDTRLDGSPAIDAVGHGYPLISRAMYGRIGLAGVKSVTQLAIDLGRRREAGMAERKRPPLGRIGRPSSRNKGSRCGWLVRPCRTRRRQVRQSRPRGCDADHEIGD